MCVLHLCAAELGLQCPSRPQSKMIFVLYVSIAAVPSWAAHETYARVYPTEASCLRSAKLAQKRHQNVVTHCIRHEGLEAPG